MSTIAIYPGSFDPMTIGHVDLVQRGSKLFERLLVAIASSSQKKPLFSLKDRIALARQSLAGMKNVEVHGCDELIVKFAVRHKANVVLRGVRSTTDFEYELQLAGMNRSMFNHIETLFLPPSLELAAISSSLIKEIAKLGGDVSPFVPSCVNIELNKKYKS